MNTSPKLILTLKLTNPEAYAEIMREFFLRQDPASDLPTDVVIETHYFDSEDLRLSSQGLALKIMKSNGQCCATAEQTPHSGAKKRLVCKQMDIQSMVPDIHLFLKHAIGRRLLEVLEDSRISPLFSVCLTQQDVTVKIGHSGLAKMTGKQGYINFGDKQMPVCEIEIEIKSGNVDEFLAFASQCSEKHALLIERKSLYERGLVLTGIKLMKREVLYTIKQDKRQSVAEAFRDILMHYLTEIMEAQSHYLDLPEDPERVHRLRVKIRQFRSILSLCSPLFCRDEYLIRQEDARKLEHLFARARELDVLLAEWNGMQVKEWDDEAVNGRMTQLLERERDREKQSLYTAVSRGTTTQTLLDIGAWLHEETCFTHKNLDMTLRHFVEKRLAKWARRIKKTESLKAMDLQEIHTLRIRCKKMRYTLACFIEVLPENKTKNKIVKLKIMQDQLGTLCDTKRNKDLFERIIQNEKTEGMQYAHGLLNGYQACKYKMILDHLSGEG